MIIHNIIVAVRNIWKYKTQNLISILGLSVALLCFSICLYCTRYIYSTDHCFENLDRLVQVTTADKETGKAKELYRISPMFSKSSTKNELICRDEFRSAGGNSSRSLL